MDDTTQKNDKPGLNDTEGYALELIERWKARELQELIDGCPVCGRARSGSCWCPTALIE